MDPFYAFLIFAVLLVLEHLASQSWLKPYYLSGIPVFFISGRVNAAADLTALAAWLTESFKSSPTHPSIFFKQIGLTQIALREALFELRAGIRYLPVMHAYIRFNPTGETFHITGYLNWSILAALVYLVYRATSDQTFFPVAILLMVVLVISYLSQVALLRQVASRLANTVSRDGR